MLPPGVHSGKRKFLGVEISPSSLVIAHRGASAHAPENTLEAFQRARALGADWVELDVRRTADGVLVVHHDPHLPDGRAIVDLPAAELPAHVPRLEAALEASTPLGVNVEVKELPGEPGFDDDREPLARQVVAALRAFRGEVLVSSFDPRMVDAVRDLGVPTAQLTFLPDRPIPELVAAIAERGHRAWHPYHEVLDAEAVDAARAAGLAVNAWTCDDPERIAALAAWGVAGVVTNDVPTALAALGRT